MSCKHIIASDWKELQDDLNEWFDEMSDTLDNEMEIVSVQYSTCCPLEDSIVYSCLIIYK